MSSESNILEGLIHAFKIAQKDMEWKPFEYQTQCLVECHIDPYMNQFSEELLEKEIWFTDFCKTMRGDGTAIRSGKEIAIQALKTLEKFRE